MLESMIVNPRPTRAECSDVANAVIDGADAVMLSGETANGSFPRGAVEIMARTCLEAEKMVADEDKTGGYDEIFKLMKSAKLRKTTLTPAESAASSAVKTACDISAKAIIVLSETGETARLLAKFHPASQIIAVCVDGRVARQIEGYMCNGISVLTDVKRGDGAHVRLAFAEVCTLAATWRRPAHGRREPMDGVAWTAACTAAWTAARTAARTATRTAARTAARMATRRAASVKL